MTTNFIGVLLANSPNYTVNTGFSTQLYDAAGAQTITVQAGASLSLVGAMGANTVRLAGNASAWQVFRDGSTAVFVNTDGSRVEVAANTVAQILQFDDGTRGLSINTSGAAPAVVLGSQTLEASAVAISTSPASGTGGGTPAVPTTPSVGSTVNAPWTLVMNANNGIYSSDGTAAGTEYVLGAGLSINSGSAISNVFLLNDDRSKAFFDQSEYSYFTGGSLRKVGTTDGTVANTSVLATSSTGNEIPSGFITVNGNQLVLAGSTISGAKILVSDGSVAGTSLVASDYAVIGGVKDPAHQAVWFAASTAPYGQELIRFSYATGTAPNTTMVKDIYSGSSSSLRYGVSGAVLPNGKLVYGADDGVHGEEAWVSDGSEAGTFMLADLYTAQAAIGSSPSWFITFGNKVVFSASVNLPVISPAVSIASGQNLIFTDGSTAGTNILNVNPGGYGHGLSMLGQANGLLYYTAITGGIYNSVSGVRSPEIKGIFSTNGTTFTKLADINSSASLLGWDSNKAFFKVSEAAHGDELWSADLATGSFALVKDILPGSGSALALPANGFSNSAQMVGGKLAFTAYTAATQQALFLSDGTDAGTVQLANSLPTFSKAVGNTLVFANASGVYGVAAGSATPTAVELINAATVGGVVSASVLSTVNVSNGSPVPVAMPAPTPPPGASSSFQSDTDQVFFKLSNGDLFSTTGTVAGTEKLAGSVVNFKVVAENAMFFVQQSSTADASLWYTDGSSAGTHFVEALPANFNFDMANAVALTTIGISPVVG